MKRTTVNEFSRLGGWKSGYSHLYESAYVYRSYFERDLKRFEALEVEIRGASGVPEEHMNSYIDHETRLLRGSLSRSFESAKLYACMAIESFVNYYGTVRLGEDTYKRLVERVGITEKISLLYLICFDELLDPKSELLKGIRSAFDARNSMVHPKTKEIDMGNLEAFAHVRPQDWDITTTFSALEGFIDSVCHIDKDVVRSFYFKRNKEAEQSGAGEPVTRSELESGGGAKSQLESEGDGSRCQA